MIAGLERPRVSASRATDAQSLVRRPGLPLQLLVETVVAGDGLAGVEGKATQRPGKSVVGVVGVEQHPSAPPRADVGDSLRSQCQSLSQSGPHLFERIGAPNQFLDLSTSRLALIQGIMLRNRSPTCSMGCS